MSTQMALTELGRNRHAVIVEVTGGRGISQKLSSMGIRPGKRITKVSEMFMRSSYVSHLDISLTVAPPDAPLP